MSQFSVTEVVTATRCPRQLVLLREGRRVFPHGGAAVGPIAHDALSALARGAAADPALLAALAAAEPSPEQVEAACYVLAYAEAYQHAARVAPTVDGADLVRLDGIVRSLAGLIAALLCRARRGSRSAAEAVQRALRASEDRVSLDVAGHEIRGTADLLCHDVEKKQTWVWDLKTYAGTDRAQEEQVRLYALAYASRGIQARPALLHVTGERIELCEAPPLKAIGVEALGARLRRMSAWLEGTEAPPPAPELSTCRTCPAQAPCWSRWGRTLPDAESDDREGAAPGPRVASPASPPLPAPLPPPLPAPLPREKREPAADAPPTQPAPVASRPAPVASRPAPAPVAPSAPLDPPPLWPGNGELDKSPVHMDPADLLRHVAVFGATGAGKSYFAKSIVEEAVLAGVPALVFDVQGDLVQFARLQDNAHPSLAARRDAYAARAEVRLFTPASDAGLRVSLNPLRLPEPDLGEDARAFCHGAIAENLLGALNVPRPWRDLAREYLAQHLEAAPPTLTLDMLVDRVLDPSDLPGPPLLSKRGQREALAEQLRLLTEGTQRFLFQRGRRLDIGDLVRPTAPGKVPLNVIWLNALADVEAKQRFVAMVLSDVYAWMLRNPSPKPQLLLYFDEVGPYMPPQREPPPKKILRRIFQEGRKYGVCGLFCTQNFTDVDYKVLAQANTKFMGKIGSPQDKERARKMLPVVRGFDPAAAAQRLVDATSGVFLASGGSFPRPRWLKGRPLLVHHEAPWGEEEIAAHTPEGLRAHFQ